jgi:hypothetical protein
MKMLVRPELLRRVPLALFLIACGGTSPGTTAPSTAGIHGEGRPFAAILAAIPAADRAAAERNQAVIEALVGHPVTITVGAGVPEAFGENLPRAVTYSFELATSDLVRVADRDLSSLKGISIALGPAEKTTFEAGTLACIHDDPHSGTPLFRFSNKTLDAFPAGPRDRGATEFQNVDPTALAPARYGAYLKWLTATKSRGSMADRNGEAAAQELRRAVRFAEITAKTPLGPSAGEVVVSYLSWLRDAVPQPGGGLCAAAPAAGTYLATQGARLANSDQDEVLRVLSLPSTCADFERQVPAILEPVLPRVFEKDRPILSAVSRSKEMSKRLGTLLATMPDPLPAATDARGDRTPRSKAVVAANLVAGLRRERDADSALFAFLEGGATDAKTLRATLLALGTEGPRSSVGWVPAYRELWAAHPEQRSAILVALTGLPTDGIADPFKDSKQFAQQFAPLQDRTMFEAFLREGPLALRALPRAWPAFASSAPSGEAIVAAVPAYFAERDGYRSSNTLREIRNRLCEARSYRELGILFEGFKQHNRPGEDPRWEKTAPEMDPRTCSSAGDSGHRDGHNPW